MSQSGGSGEVDEDYKVWATISLTVVRWASISITPRGGEPMSKASRERAASHTRLNTPTGATTRRTSEQER